MTSNSEPILTAAETVAQVAKLTEAIYVAHIHGGKAYISIASAIEMASSVVGAIQSKAVFAIVKDAIANPTKSLDEHNARRLRSNSEVDRDQLGKIDRLANAIELEKSKPGPTYRSWTE